MLRERPARSRAVFSTARAAANSTCR